MWRQGLAVVGGGCILLLYESGGRRGRVVSRERKGRGGKGF